MKSACKIVGALLLIGSLAACTTIEGQRDTDTFVERELKRRGIAEDNAVKPQTETVTESAPSDAPAV